MSTSFMPGCYPAADVLDAMYKRHTDDAWTKIPIGGAKASAGALLQKVVNRGALGCVPA